MGKKEHQIWQRYVHQATDTILSGQKSLTRVVALTTHYVHNSLQNIIFKSDNGFSCFEKLKSSLYIGISHYSDFGSSMHFQQNLYKQILESQISSDVRSALIRIIFHTLRKSLGYETFHVVIHFLVLHDVEHLCKAWDQAPKIVHWEETIMSKFKLFM